MFCRCSRFSDPGSSTRSSDPLVGFVCFEV